MAAPAAWRHTSVTGAHRISAVAAMGSSYMKQKACRIMA